MGSPVLSFLAVMGARRQNGNHYILEARKVCWRFPWGKGTFVPFPRVNPNPRCGAIWGYLSLHQLLC